MSVDIRDVDPAVSTSHSSTDRSPPTPALIGDDQRGSAEARLAFLAEAGALLASSLDDTTTLERLARVSVPAVADLCLIDMWDDPDHPESSTIRRVAAAHADPAADEIVQERLRKFPPDPHGGHPAVAVMRTGTANLTPVAAESTLRATTRTPEHFDLVWKLGYRSYLIVPVALRDRVLGTMTFISTSARRLGETDLALAEQLATRAAVSIDHARTYRALAESERRLRMLAEVGVVVGNGLDMRALLHAIANLMVERIADGCSVHVANGNGTFERTAVITRDPAVTDVIEAVQQGVKPVIPPAYVNVLRDGCAVLLQGADADPVQLFAAAQDPERYERLLALGIYSVIIVPLFARERILGVLTLARADIGRTTERHPFTNEDLSLAEDIGRRAALAIDNAQLYAAEQRARAQAEAASAAKSEFLATMSHELRTPLNAILGYAELMTLGIRGELNDAQRDDLTRIRQSGQYLLGLINDLLNFARLEAGRVEVATKEIDVFHTIADVETLLRPQLTGKRIRYVVTPSAHAVHAVADEEKLRQILVNLLGNAVKFTGEGGTITVSAREHDDDVMIDVIDTGVGIPADKLTAIFEPFVQLGRTRISPVEGTGLGLAISRELARAMHGDLTATSIVGNGSTFTVRLPKPR